MTIASLCPLTAARFANPDDTQYVFEVIDALQGPSLHRLRERLRRTERGRHLLAERPNILQRLADRQALRTLPSGSLGRAYLAFVEAEGISADGLVEASTETRRNPVEEELQWVRNWLRDTHDLWHVVLGYQGDLVGEAALLAFTHRQGGNFGIGMIASMAWYKLGRVTPRHIRARQVVLEGRRRAKRAAWFIDAPWHEWLGRSLDDVRRELGVEGSFTYQPVRTREVDVSLAG